MKFKLELTINKPRSKVWDLFTTPENMDKWQPSLTNIELMNGTPGQAGAVSKLTYKENEREFSLVETITQRDDLSQFDLLYENEFTDNPVRNTFIEQSENETLWVLDTEFKFKTFLMKILGPILKKNLVRRTQKDMDRFKEFAES
jgi:uncharacterized protein YndB with AHSA1/START domain